MKDFLAHLAKERHMEDLGNYLRTNYPFVWWKPKTWMEPISSWLALRAYRRERLDKWFEENYRVEVSYKRNP